MRALHRVRESLIRDKVKTTNQIHGFLLEFGISLPIGEAVIKRLSLILAEHGIPRYPESSADEITFPLSLPC